MRRGWVGGVLLPLVLMGLAGCPAAPGPPPKVAEEEPPRPTSIKLERADSSEALSVAAQLLGEPVLVDALSLVWLRCLTVTLNEPGPLLPKVAAEQLFDALRAQGVRIEVLASSKRDGETWIVKIHERPAACPAPEAERLAVVPVADGGAPALADAETVLKEVLQSIRQISPTEHAITQRGLELFLENESMLLRSARIAPEQAGGKVSGIRLFGVRPDGLLGRLGFENGDRVDRVMGKSMNTPEEALDAYASMRSAKVIDIEVNRRGVATKLTVHVE